ncbi:MAG: tRNA (adenosine(37)-N6)-dimethylallyltransferase MiaA [Niabella sp.]
MSYIKSVIVIAGPTAVGKTAHAIEVARYFNTVILSADSRQCYKEMDIGVARPSAQELQQVPHYFIASHSIQEPINAAWYDTYALNLLQELFKEKDTIVVTGGTGLYIKALIEGMDAIPQVDTTIRDNIIIQYKEKGIAWLQQQLQELDPLFFASGEMQNPQRMMRALEVIQATGRSIISFRSQKKNPRPFNIIQVGLELPRDVLYERINARTDVMMQAGLVAEVERLTDYKRLNALQTVGYKEIFDYLDGKTLLQTATDLIKQNTRRYAKRQMTWFKRQPGMNWINLEKTPYILPLITSLVRQ